MHTINRLTQPSKGAGLPFYRKEEYQERFTETAPTGSPLGYWIVPQNKLPTFQIWIQKAGALSISTVEIVPTTGGTDGAAITIPNANIVELCAEDTAEENEYLILTCKDEDRAFTLTCGTYFVRITLDNSAVYYSEEFIVGGICSLEYSLDFEVTQVNVDLSADVEMTFTTPNPIVGFAVTIGVDTYITSPFTHTFADGTTQLTIEIETENCGIFAQNYEFVNNGGLTFSLTKTYS